MAARHMQLMIDLALDQVIEELMEELLQVVLQDMVVLMNYISIASTLYILGAPPLST